MLFLRSICLVAVTAYVAFTSASPVQKSSVDMIQPFGISATLLDAGVTTDGGADVVGVETNIRRHEIEHLAEARETLKSLPDILSSTRLQLTDVYVQAKYLRQDEKKPDLVDAIHDYVNNVHLILLDTLVNIKLLQGNPLDVILGDCSVIDLASLLSTVLTLVVEILLALLACSGPNRHTVIDTIVKTISVVLCDLLSLVFRLVSGLLILLLPLLAGILGLLTSCGLGDVLNLLKL